MCEYGFIWIGHGKARYWVFIFIHMVQEFWKVWLLHLGKLINLGWVVWHVLAGDTHTNDAPEDDSYSVPDGLECIGV